MTTLEQYLTEAEAAVHQLVRPNEWPHLSPATFTALRATAKAAYMQGRLDQAIKAANERLNESLARTHELAAENERIAAELAPKPDLHEVSQICVQCGSKSVLMSRDPKAPAEVRGLCDRCIRSA